MGSATVLNSEMTFGNYHDTILNTQSTMRIAPMRAKI